MYPFGDPTRSAQKRANWFEQMDGFLSWKLVPPNITDPFSPPIPDHVLQELARNARALRRLCTVRCLCDGYEIMSIKNLSAPIIRTDHPCITSMPRRDILGFLKRSGISQRIDEEIRNVRAQIEEELQRRASRGERHDDDFSLSRSLAADGKRKKKKGENSKGFEYRVIRL